MEEKKYNNVQHHRDLCDQLNSIYEAKNHDYGDSFHQTFLEEGFAMSRIRLSDKLNRFKALSKANAIREVLNESIEDTLMDLANYAIMTVLEMQRVTKEYTISMTYMSCAPVERRPDHA